MKVFSTKFHGLLDYATVIQLPVLARVLGADEDTRHVADGGALAVLAYSLLTNYERGAIRVLPMRVHLVLDAAFGAALCTAALRQTRDKAIVRCALAALGLFSLFASVATETEPRSAG